MFLLKTFVPDFAHLQNNVQSTEHEDIGMRRLNIYEIVRIPTFGFSN